jgi:hypothetical protein
MFSNPTFAKKHKLLFAGAFSLAVTLMVATAASAGPSGLPSHTDFMYHSDAFGDHFAIADLDGDKLPDLATVSINGDASPHTSYSIRLRLSTHSDFAFGLSAPWGGLQISPRDVNGDDSIDLVVTTVLDSQLVAVLLNDGHGNFTFADPASFPTLEAPADSRLRSPYPLSDACDTLCPSRSSTGEPPDLSNSGAFHLYGSVVYSRAINTVVSSILHTRLGRAPPNFFLFS